MGADLETPAGPLNAVATFNAQDLSQEYDLEGSVEDFRLSELFPEAPDPTVVTGRVALRGSGLDPETLRGRLDVEAHNSLVGKVQVDSVEASVWVDDEETRLTALEYRLLNTFFERRGRVQTRQTLLTDVWGYRPDITTRTVDTHVKRLREKLGAAGRYVETVRGVGYRFRETPDEVG